MYARDKNTVGNAQKYAEPEQSRSNTNENVV